MDYVLGFLFDGPSKVVLIRKEKPDWQKGLLNGIGGKIEADEDPSAAMSREFEEEAGTKIAPSAWSYYCEMKGISDDFSVKCFCLDSGEHLKQARSVESEKVEVVDVRNLEYLPRVDNLDWLVLAALDFLHDGKPFIEARY